MQSKLLAENIDLTDANAALFDAANGFAGCIPGIMEVLSRVGLSPSNLCLDADEVLSAGQTDELDRVMKQHPHLLDDGFVKQNSETVVGRLGGLTIIKIPKAEPTIPITA